MLLLAMLPSYLIRFSVFGIPATLLEMMILICFTVWFVQKTEFKNFLRGKYGWRDFFINKKKRASYLFAPEIALWLIVSYIAMIPSGFSNASFGIWKAYFFEPLLVYILIINIFKPGQKSFQKIILPLAISTCALSLIAIFQKFTGLFVVEHFLPRVTSVFSYPNALGLFLAPIILILIGFLIQELTNFPPRADQPPAEKNKGQSCQLCQKYNLILFLITSVILSLSAIYFASSEGALVGVLAGLIAFGILANKKSRITTIIILIILSGATFTIPKLKSYALQKVTLKDLSGEIRKQQWRETWTMLHDGNKILGSGLSNYQNKIAPYHQEGIFFNFSNDPDFRRKIVIFDDKYRAEHWQPVEIYMYPHNILLNFWTEIGFLGMLVFVWIVDKFFIIAIQNSKFKIQNSNYFLNLGLTCSMVTIIVHGLVDVPYFKNDLSVIFWVIIALISLIKLSNSIKPDNPNYEPKPKTKK
ncbi:hypothetical protein A2331_02505 [Candidatus Falkowbacteria bacterium RIFOXYB2_FULL_34_18]|uniref:O-antigen ligase-related domain-containing protein n=1 Tax=Candidatus Falkowbacteria bacterium RIFOXYD2_FULL_34_120 TaxID=1798007 RepID=A0A1F5TQW6_9BACT|nr:MAG: hypothetical protein A2331_02505 [Candidatus Falkowbacteria bacterium RIFOXYB2_FULL_34_18]OGF29493.1 MAG: hypothetical protein A2500_04355 [Candidatus Falkowbacteria bacterium RIFOXYC12_FULL_34_55]OGF36310.1 MAG: hypothetical protein A2466_05365 [Candidatus Falkowbacteria bacterium RIFOXYC2_FULL_34_220]OGF39019.1 MAG: hypothetical protein A2515_06820 [Candidatus Falkowbacteria bacterium RIFOXYD12_FULL_34_57]OGF41238.1 MAG: hypothetical protein A2531_01060 [Candidatus Falkowbacteria bact